MGGKFWPFWRLRHPARHSGSLALKVPILAEQTTKRANGGMELMQLYHRTKAETAEEILADGFNQGQGGVLFTDNPPECHEGDTLLAIEIDDETASWHERTKAGETYRSFRIPDTVANAYRPARVVDPLAGVFGGQRTKTIAVILRHGDELELLIRPETDEGAFREKAHQHGIRIPDDATVKRITTVNPDDLVHAKLMDTHIRKRGKNFIIAPDDIKTIYFGTTSTDVSESSNGQDDRS